MELKRAHGISIECRDEDNQRGSLSLDCGEHLETIEIRHLYIEEKDLRLELKYLRNRIFASGAGGYDLGLLCFVNEPGQSTPSNFLVVGDDYAQHLSLVESSLECASIILSACSAVPSASSRAGVTPRSSVH